MYDSWIKYIIMIIIIIVNNGCNSSLQGYKLTHAT